MRPASPRTWLLLASLAVAAAPPLGCGDSTSPAEGAGSLLAIGAEAPKLAATDHRGQSVDLGVPTAVRVVYFYPKDDTPGCTKEACAFRDAWARFVEAGVEVIGVSADDSDSHRAFASKHELPFALIADPELVWARAFGVETTMGMTARVSFLIDKQGKIAQVYPGVDPAIHAQEVLRDAAALK